MRALNQSRGTVLCARLENAGGVAGQSKGLLGRDGLEPGAGMLFENSWFTLMMWMDMLSMRFAIDIVLAAATRSSGSSRRAAAVAGSRWYLERVERWSLRQGAAEKSCIGDQITFETIS